MNILSTILEQTSITLNELIYIRLYNQQFEKLTKQKLTYEQKKIKTLQNLAHVLSDRELDILINILDDISYYNNANKLTNHTLWTNKEIELLTIAISTYPQNINKITKYISRLIGRNKMAAKVKYYKHIKNNPKFLQTHCFIALITPTIKPIIKNNLGVKASNFVKANNISI